MRGNQRVPPDPGENVRALSPGDETLGTVTAARLLGVPPAVLRTWEQRYGTPRSTSVHRRRRFSRAEVLALGAALETAAGVEEAVRSVRRPPDDECPG